MFEAATPNNMCGTVLSVVQFRDELRDRYGLNILNTPSHCDGCNIKLSTTHALGCKAGGIIHSRHDECRNSLGWLACAGFQPSNVRDEPHINPCRDNGGKDESKISLNFKQGYNVKSTLIEVISSYEASGTSVMLIRLLN